MPECSIDQCAKPNFGHGFCYSHYSRWRRHGDPLKGRTSPGEPLAYLKNIVLKWEGDECLVWPFGRDANGYAKIWRYGQMQTVSRIICEMVYGIPVTRMDAAHSCGAGHLGCVNKRHLSWKTVAENSADRLIHGTDCRGERHGASKLTEPQVIHIRKLRGAVPQGVLAEKFGVSIQAISDVQCWKRWKWLPQLAEAE